MTPCFFFLAGLVAFQVEKATIDFSFWVSPGTWSETLAGQTWIQNFSQPLRYQGTCNKKLSQKPKNPPTENPRFQSRRLTTDYDCRVDWQWPEYVTDYGKAFSTHQTSDGIVEHMSQCLIAPFPEKVQIKSRLVNSFLPRLPKSMLPSSPKPGQDHPKAQQLRKPTSTSSSQGLRFSQLKKKNFSSFSLPLLIIEGPLTKW